VAVTLSSVYPEFVEGSKGCSVGKQRPNAHSLRQAQTDSAQSRAVAVTLELVEEVAGGLAVTLSLPKGRSVGHSTSNNIYYF
jgi:hypothetical protein